LHYSIPTFFFAGSISDRGRPSHALA